MAMGSNLLYEVKLCFYEPPNFSMCADKEEVVLARLNSMKAAQIFCKAYALASLQSLGENIKTFEDLELDPNNPWSVVYDVNNIYLSLVYQNKYVAHLYRIEMVCPNCGVNPNDLGRPNNKFCPVCNRSIFKKD